MGLDTVELVMAFENEFDIRIPDEMATEMVDVGTTATRIVEALNRKPKVQGVCPTARSFYQLRRELVDRFEVRRETVRPATPIGQLVPDRERRRTWSKIADASGLRREPNVIFTLRFPDPQTSVGSLIRTRCKTTYRRFDGSIDEAAVFQHVRQVVSQQLGVSIERIDWTTRYIEDLGAD